MSPIRFLRRLALIVGLALPGLPLAAEPVVLALGDSLTAGYGLAPEDGLVPQLSRWLADHGHPAQVINAGVSGDTTAGGRARLEWSLEPQVQAVIVALGGNDLLRGIAPEEARANLEAILGAVRAKGLPVLLVGLAAPGNYGAAYQRDFDAIWPELAAKYDAVLLPNLLAPIMALPLEERAKRDLMQGDNIHPAPAGVALVVEALGPKVLDLLAGVPGG